MCFQRQSVSQTLSVQEVTQCFGDFLFLDEETRSWIRKPSESMYCCCSSLPIILPWWSTTVRHAIWCTKKPHCRQRETRVRSILTAGRQLDRWAPRSHSSSVLSVLPPHVSSAFVLILTKLSNEQQLKIKQNRWVSILPEKTAAPATGDSYKFMFQW